MLARCGEKESFHALADQGWENFSTIMQPVQQNGEAIQQAVNLPEDQRYIAIAQEAGLFDFFAARGISADQARSCLADPAKARAIAQNTAEQSDELGVTGTPTFFLNGQKLEVNQWPGLEPILQQAGARDAGA
jgi:protein-disulfide isomerase